MNRLAPIFVLTALLSLQSQASTEKPAVVSVLSIKKTDLFDTLSYPARAISKVNTTVVYEAEGVGLVKELLAPLGTRVVRNQKLMTIVHTDPIYKFAPVVLRAPISGIVSSLEITQGTQVTQGQKVLMITDPASIRLVVEVPAADLAVLKSGMKGEFRIPGRDDAVAVKVAGISPMVDPGTGTATCEIEVDPGTAISPGMIGQVSFKTNQRQGILVPDQALVYKGTDPFLRLVENGKAKQVAVKLGHRQRGSVEVLEGVSEGASVVERASKHVSDGDTVEVQAPEGKAQ